MRFDWSTFALQLVNFAILVWLLQRFLYRPVLRAVDARRAAAGREYAEAQKAAQAARQALSDLDRERAGIAAERTALLEQARVEASRLLEAGRSQAEQATGELMEETRKTLAREREQALEEARRATLDLASDIVRRLLAEMPETLRAQPWLERIEQRLRSLPQAELAELAGELGGGGTLLVVTASPVEADATDDWRARLRAALGRDARIDFETDPALIAGAELRFPHATLGFTMRTAVRALQEDPKAHDQPR